MLNMEKNSAAVLLLSAVIAAAFLSGCGSNKAAGVPEPTAAVSAVAQTPAETVSTVAAPDGTELDSRSTTLDLTGLNSKDIQAAVDCVLKLPELKLIDLGAERGGLSWEDIKQLCDSTDADISYSFTLYGKAYHLADTRVDLNHITMVDDGALVCQVISCMPNLRYLDMDSCGVSNDGMERIQSCAPNAKVIWRIWFGDHYSVRTDTERILASRPSVGGTLSAKDCEVLKYCTDVKYLDIGNNTIISDISFLGFMPQLEVAILAKNNFSDLRPISNCKNLEYLEIQETAVSDLSPLSELKNLKHLNICLCSNVLDISPLYPLTQLERLWIGGVINVPAEQVEKMQAAAPGCLINVTAGDPAEGMWRYAVVGDIYPFHPRYIELMEQFGNYDEKAYSYAENDPLL